LRTGTLFAEEAPEQNNIGKGDPMKSMLRKAVGFASAIGFALMAGAATASPIVLDQWYTFGFSGAGGDPLISGSGGFTLGIRSLAAPTPAWTFTCVTTCELVVTDGFIAIDQFELFDSGTSLGSTSVPSGDRAHSCSNDEVACLADPQMSHGAFVLAAGDHTITGIHLIGSPGAAFFIVSAVPEPASLALIGVGLLMLLGMRRRA
jgi:PEP-CTERM motif-containing protein